MRTVSIAVGLLLLCVGDTLATSPTITRRSCQEASPNREFFLKADCEKKTVEIFANANLGVPLWSFEYDVQHDEFVLSDDGEMVVILWWPRQKSKVRNREGTALRFWERQKGEFKTHKLSAVCDDISRVGEVSHAIFFSISDGAWFRGKPELRGETLRVYTIDNHRCEFSIKTGELLDRQRVLGFWEWVLIGLAIVVVVIVVAIVAFCAGLFSLVYCLLGKKSAGRPRSTD